MRPPSAKRCVTIRGNFTPESSVWMWKIRPRWRTLLLKPSSGGGALDTARPNQILRVTEPRTLPRQRVPRPFPLRRALEPENTPKPPSYICSETSATQIFFTEDRKIGRFFGFEPRDVVERDSS